MEPKIEIPLKNVESIGYMIKRVRNRKGWTQIELSERARIPQPMLSMIEAGKRSPEAQTLFHLCQVLGMELLVREK